MFTFSNGLKMPAIGLGTWRVSFLIPFELNKFNNEK